ncbi:MAG TPA: hypothetical protein VHW23_36695 [Kofleriaceae bacterium]|jgi:hypothetical protein|nr:hypothetical protein [Kofleriaceae bacterium]
MTTIMRKFLNVAMTERTDGWLELRYDDAIRAVMPGELQVAMPAGSPLGDPASGAIRLQGTGITSLSCTEPDCIKGVPPLQHAPPEQIPFWMELQAADVEVMDGGTSCLIVRGSTAQIAVPMFDAALGADGMLCGGLKAYRKSAAMVGCVAFHVYLITTAPDPLAVLRGKRIALPIPSHLVAAAASVQRIRSSA